jgi:hypothetical protein
MSGLSPTGRRAFHCIWGHRRASREAPEGSPEDAESRQARCLLARVEEDLHAHADAEEGLAPLDVPAHDLLEARGLKLSITWRKWPCPGRTRASARPALAGSLDTVTLRPAASSALAADRRLPEP